VFQVCKYLFPMVLAGSLLPAQPLRTAEGVTGSLVTANALARHLGDTDVVILDASPAQVYAAKHIPGALSVDLFTFGLPDASAVEMEKRFQSWGISSGKTVVMYDQGGSMMATRVLFSLLYYGFPAKDLFVLDGGLAKWQELGLPIARNLTPVPKPGSFRIGKLNEGVKANLPDVLNASGDPVNNVLVEALGADWHFGQVRVFNRAGHIPRGILLPSTDFYNPDKTFKPAAEIRRMLTYYGIRPEQRIYTYCGGGVAASVPFFALKFILNYPNVKLYVGSELDWLSDERELPYWTYDAPYLIRESDWLQFWSGRMPRAMGITHVSVVDVRPAGAFNQGHVPFALNIPADKFQSNLRTPAKLAGILGPAGVHAADEAVVVSDGGLTRASALAFVMLQKMGQRKVSVFMDSMEKWTRLGHTLTKDPTAVGAKKGPQDVSIPPTSYPADFREGVVIADPNASQGVYPKVYVASGEKLPSHAPEGKMIHVPFTELLNPDGTPKAAKDVWNILTKAGVPRYAELVCVSDDPGEAAINYFVLLLMGYPNVKVLV